MRRGRSVGEDPCPPCIPVYLQEAYREKCPGVAICLPKKRSVVPNCPQCIEWYEVGVYKKDCPHTPYCNKPTATTNCPSCLTLDEAKVYKVQCPNTPLCYRKRPSTDDCSLCIPASPSKDCSTVCNKTKRSIFCPPCIPKKLEEYRRYCPQGHPICSF